MNQLRGDLVMGAFSPAEDQRIVELQATLGNRWSAIAKELPGRWVMRRLAGAPGRGVGRSGGRVECVALRQGAWRQVVGIWVGKSARHRAQVDHSCAGSCSKERAELLAGAASALLCCVTPLRALLYVGPTT